MLHFHGGAFFTGSSKTHRAMGSEFAVRGKVNVYMPDYRRAPEHPYPAALDDGWAAYHALLEQGYQPHDIVLGGDSGGCALILSLAIRLRDRNLPLPAGLVMLSPFLDLTLNSASIEIYRRRDPMVSRYALLRGANAFRGAIAADDPRVSPLFADLHGLPTTLIQVGGDEILLDDAIRFATRARDAGMPVENQIHDGMWHNFQMFNRFVEPADRALDDIARFVRDVLNRQSHPIPEGRRSNYELLS
ncbi:alpha/beta hydrolase [Burkholderia cenocepacia]|nr:alpha/beta hydrolase [Burkholderia cenocepacia]